MGLNNDKVMTGANILVSSCCKMKWILCRQSCVMINLKVGVEVTLYAYVYYVFHLRIRRDYFTGLFQYQSSSLPCTHSFLYLDLHSLSLTGDLLLFSVLLCFFLGTVSDVEIKVRS